MVDLFSLDVLCIPGRFLATLWNLKSGRRASQTFHFDSNDAGVCRMLGAHLQNDDITRSSRASFATHVANRAVALVVEIYHVPSGDVDTALERFIKAKTAGGVKDKERAKIVDEISDACARGGQHRQLLGVAALRLFDAQQQFVVGGGDGSLADRTLIDFVWCLVWPFGVFGVARSGCVVVVA